MLRYDFIEMYNKLVTSALQDNIISEDEMRIIQDAIAQIDLSNSLYDEISVSTKLGLAKVLFRTFNGILISAYQSAKSDGRITEDEYKLIESIKSYMKEKGVPRLLATEF